MENHSDIIELIRKKLFDKRMSIKELIQKSQMERYTITNVLAKKSRNFDNIIKILNALDIPLITDSIKPSLSNDNEKINSQIYLKSTKIATTVIDKKKISLKKETFCEFVFEIYSYILQNQNETEKVYLAYADGLWHHRSKKA